MGEFDVEAAAEFTGFGRRTDAERSCRRIAGPAAHPPGAILEHEFKHHLGLLANPSLAVKDDDQFPLIRTEFEAPGTDSADAGSDEDPGAMVATERSGR